MQRQWLNYGGYAFLVLGLALIVVHFVRPGLHALMAGIIIVISGAIILATASRR